MLIGARRQQPVRDQQGFTLVEFMIAAAITTAVLGGTVFLATQLQQVYSTQLDDVTVEQEGRFALDWIARALRSAGSNPYGIAAWGCPSGGTTFQAIRMDPNGTGKNDNIRIQSDINPPDGTLGGPAGVCDQTDEDITIAHDPAAQAITRRDNNTDPSPRTMTEPIITELLFTYLDSSRNVTNNPNAMTYVHVRITGRSNAYNAILGNYGTSTLETEVRLRIR